MAQPVVPPATPVPPAATAATPSFMKQVSAWLKGSKPLREAVAIIAALIVSVSGAVAWIVAHFATRAEMHYLECRVTHNLLTQLLPIHLGEFAGKIDWRATEIKALAQHGGGTPQSIARIADLTDQVNALTKEQQAAGTKLQQEIADLVQKCLTEFSQVEKTQ